MEHRNILGRHRPAGMADSGQTSEDHAMTELEIGRTCLACRRTFWTPMDQGSLPDYCPPCDDLLREMVDDGRNRYDEQDMLAEKREACGEFDGRADDSRDEGGEA